MYIVFKKMTIKSLWRFIKALLITSLKSLGSTGIVDLDKDANSHAAERIITDGIGMKP